MPNPFHTHLLCHCPRICAGVCPGSTPALAGLPIPDAALGHCPAVTQPHCCLCLQPEQDSRDEWLPLEWMPASLCGHRLVMVPSARPAWGWQVNVSLFLSAPP